MCVCVCVCVSSLSVDTVKFSSSSRAVTGTQSAVSVCPLFWIPQRRRRPSLRPTTAQSPYQEDNNVGQV